MDLIYKIVLPCGCEVEAEDIVEFAFNTIAGTMTVRTREGVGHSFTLEDYRECRKLKRVFGSVMWANHIIAERMNVDSK